MPTWLSLPVGMVSEYHLVLGEKGWWQREGSVAAAHLCSPRCCLPSFYLPNSTTWFPTGLLDPHPPVVGIKCWVKRSIRTWVVAPFDTNHIFCRSPCDVDAERFGDVSVTAKHCLIHPFEREKYLEQSWNAIKILCRWKLPPISAGLSSV